ncbi:hypothetical protein J437_LFUL016189 [Ladona fulva]|uniref:C2 domain-containing protein n=1 Tax=Ladona fulva TaxID=123851 RepID=A0A8K0KL29_LADFU|nr:hypothetical protein J437_LFUL016189 [Ladona fulva]
MPCNFFLQAKKEMYDIKQQRLCLAQDEYNHLNNALSTLNTSRTMCSSSSSNVSTKYDPDLLRSDVAHARSRVSRLKRELEQIRTEMSYTQKGVETLALVEAKLSRQEGGGGGGVYNVNEAQAIMTELRNIQRSLSSGEREKAELMQSLAKLKDDLTRLQLTTATPTSAAAALASDNSSPDVSTLSLPHEKLSTASQTDLSGELVPIGTRLAEMARMRLQYDEARKSVQQIQSQLADLEEKMTPGQAESDKDRLLLFQEKEQLLRELRSITPRSRSQREMEGVQAEIRRLEQDLNAAMELSNRAIADRLRLHEEKQALLQQLKGALRSMSILESRLRTLSASTLSTASSSCSSLGSSSSPGSSRASSSQASSKGSLSGASSNTCLSFTDIYGGPQWFCCPSTPLTHAPSRLPLLSTTSALPTSPCSASSAYSSSSSSTALAQPQPTPTTPTLGNSMPTLDPSEGDMPPAVDMADLHRRVERLLRGSTDAISVSLTSTRETTIFTTPRTVMPAQMPVNSFPRTASLPSDTGLPPPYEQAYLSSAERQRRTGLVDSTQSLGLVRPASTASQAEVGVAQSVSSTPPSPPSVAPPLSPISESVSAAVSDESVAGDSGVFEAGGAKGRCGRGNSAEALSQMSLETAQVQIKLRYAMSESLLHVGIERARNLTALFIPSNCQVCIRAALLPGSACGAGGEALICCTKAVDDLNRPTFGETFPMPVALPQLYTKTLQVNVWSIRAVSTQEGGSVIEGKEFISEDEEDCLGCAQVSLADFNPEAPPSTKWYNILSFRFMQVEKGMAAAVTSPVSTAQTHMVTTPCVGQAAESGAGSGGGASGAAIHGGLVTKEESSDESTIISSQTSTLTRNQGAEGLQSSVNVQTNTTGSGDEEEDDEEDDDDEEDVIEEEDEEEDLSQEEEDEEVIVEEMLETVEENEQCIEEVEEEEVIEMADKETNTECVFIPEKGRARRKGESARVGDSSRGGSAIVIKRSQTFSPSAAVSKSQYICRLNRSDSDSSMPLYHRRPAAWGAESGLSCGTIGPGGPFQRNSVERRSLRWKRQWPGSGGSSRHSRSQSFNGTYSSSSGMIGVGTARTSLDLELDLQAQQVKLHQQQEDLRRLRELKRRLEDARAKGGDPDLAAWVLEDQLFHNLMLQAESKKKGKNHDEQRVEKMLKKTSKEMYKLRKSKAGKGKPDVITFKEKMAFFTRVNLNVPVPPECLSGGEEEEDCGRSQSSTLKRSCTPRTSCEGEVYREGSDDEEEGEERIYSTYVGTKIWSGPQHMDVPDSQSGDGNTVDKQSVKLGGDILVVGKDSNTSGKDGSREDVQRFDYVVDRALGVEV